MVLLLNYFPSFIVLVLCFYLYRILFVKSGNIVYKSKRIITSTIIAVVVFLGFQAAGPHYMPKHKIVRNPLPPIDIVEGVISDIQAKPMSGEERDRNREIEYKKPIQFIVEKKENQ